MDLACGRAAGRSVVGVRAAPERQWPEVHGQHLPAAHGRGHRSRLDLGGGGERICAPAPRARRCAIPVLLGVSFLVFLMLHLVTGRSGTMMLSEFQTNPQQIGRLRSQLTPRRATARCSSAGSSSTRCGGDLGISIRTRRPVTQRDRRESRLDPATGGRAAGADRRPDRHAARHHRGAQAAFAGSTSARWSSP